MWRSKPSKVKANKRRNSEIFFKTGIPTLESFLPGTLKQETGAFGHLSNNLKQPGTHQGSQQNVQVVPGYFWLDLKRGKTDIWSIFIPA